MEISLYTGKGCYRMPFLAAEHGADEEEDEDEDEDAFKDNTIDTPVRVRMHPISSEHNSRHNRAPTMTIEPVRICRMRKILALLLMLLGFGVLVFVASSSSWMQTDGMRMGIIQECVGLEKKDCSRTSCFTLPFVCSMILAFLGLAITLLAIPLLISAMLVLDVASKRRLYTATIVLLSFGMLTYLAALIVHTIFFVLQITSAEGDGHEHGNVGTKTPGFALFVGIFGVILLFASWMLLVTDKHGEEIGYKEKIARI